MRSGLISSRASSASRTPAMLSAIGYRSARPKTLQRKLRAAKREFEHPRENGKQNQRTG